MKKNIPLLMTTVMLVFVALLTFSVFLTNKAEAAFFKGIGDLPGAMFISYSADISADGSTVVGYSSSELGSKDPFYWEAFRWTESGGMQGLGFLSDDFKESSPSGVSADGSVVVGYSPNNPDEYEAFRWTESIGMQGLGTLYGFGDSLARDVSADGSVVVGRSRGDLLYEEAFRWTESSGMQGLGALPYVGPEEASRSSQAISVSADGSVVVGTSWSEYFEVFRWTESGGMQGLGIEGYPFDVSADGSVVVGRHKTVTGDTEAFRWTVSGGMQGLGYLHNTDNYSIAEDVTSDGSVVVGYSYDKNNYPYSQKAFIWDAVNGMRNLQDVLLNEHGLDLTGWTLYRAVGISADGSAITGYGENPDINLEAWIVTGFKPIKEGFIDVPPGHWAEEAIYKIYNAGITQGCSQNPLMFCPDVVTNREQMAVFLGRGIHGSEFTPPDATGIFSDVSLDHWAADWIEQAYNDGITVGCGTNPLKYCPTVNVTRAQMAAFLLRAIHGGSYTPPAATGIFSDVDLSNWAAPWIEQLYNEGITVGCGTNPLRYCPDASVTRAQMAVFLMRAFGL